ncbi:MAG: transcriptional regulator [Alphaproteobacteria bacterium]|nr:transcriptional regulator [Alphaproteobacteria bacterium]
MTISIKPIRTEADYDGALETIAGLMAAEQGSADGDALDVLTTLVEAYEAKHHPIDPPDPIEAIKFRMEQAGLKQAGLVPFIGPKGRVSEVLSRKRPLTLPMIRKLNAGLGIPADVLIAKPDLRSRKSTAV